MSIKKITWLLLALIVACMVALYCFIFSGFQGYVKASPDEIMQWFPRSGRIWLVIRNIVIPVAAFTLVSCLAILFILHRGRINTLLFERIKTVLNTVNTVLQRIFYPYFLLGTCYIILSLIIGEVHPFTMLPVYNSFPNYAYSFYLSNQAGKLYPSNKYFNCDIEKLSHIYIAACNSEKINTGFQRETSVQLKHAGEIMMSQIKQRGYANWPSGIVQLHRICYFMSHDSICKNDIIMNETFFK